VHRYPLGNARKFVKMASGIKCHREAQNVWKKFHLDSGKKSGERSKDHYSTESIAEALADQGSDLYQQFRLDLPKLNYLVMYIKNEKEIDFHSVGFIDLGDDPTSASAAISELLPTEEGKAAARYFFFKFNFSGKDGYRSKIVGFLWNPENGKQKEKMIYASSKSELKKKFDGIDKFPSFDDHCDIKDYLQELVVKRS